MTPRESNARAHGLTVALVATIAGAFLLAALPAHAQRASINSLANDHTGLAADHDDIQGAENHGAIPISACGTIAQPGSYVVIQNLAAAGDCLFVTADNVTIDLGGHVLTGDGTGAGVTSNADDGSPRRNIAVRNGTVTGFSNGISFVFYESIVIEGVRAVGNVNNGFELDESVFGTIAGNVAVGNGRNGISGLSNGAIIHNTVANSGSDGIGGGGGNRIAGNTVTDSGRFGIGTIGGTVADNTVSRSTNTGINGLSGALVTGNTSRLNGDDGIFVQKGSAIGNFADRNTGDGIRVVCPSNVIGNTALNSTGTNLVLSGAGCNAVNNVAP